MSHCLALIGAGPLAKTGEICTIPLELGHSSDCNEALTKCTSIKSLIKSIFSFSFLSFFFFGVTSCSTWGSVIRAQWLPKGPKEICVGLSPSTRSFLGEQGRMLCLCSLRMEMPPQVLCAVPASSLQGNKSPKPQMLVCWGC